MDRPVLEREREIDEIASAASEAADGQGSVVLIMGEAGIGKSALMETLPSVLPASGRQLVGYCDNLATPRVLGPLRDLTAGKALGEALDCGDRGRVLEALRAELIGPWRPSVLVVEDLHWADEATLDILGLLARRIADLPAVLVLTYRGEELTRNDPLVRLLGILSGTRRLRRLQPAPLSADAVRRLSLGTGLDGDRVFAATGGNPFFVTEILASGDTGDVPPTIVAAVLAQLQHIDEGTRDALERLAVVPSTVEHQLVEELVPGGLASLAEVEERGVLAVSPRRVSFRHELMRLAIVDSMPVVRRMRCHRAVLSALLRKDSGASRAQILHHAAQVGDAAAIVEHGPLAAREASAAQSHREAAAHYRLVLEHRAAFGPGEQADFLEAYAMECNTVGLVDQAVAAQSEAVRLRRGLGDPRALGSSLRALSRVCWYAGLRLRADDSAVEAVEVLRAVDDQRLLAPALSNQAQLYMLAGRRAEAIAVGQRAVAMAREIGDPGLLSHALNNVGNACWHEDRPEGRTLLEESLAVAIEAHEFDHACRAYVNMVWSLLEHNQLDEADRLLREAVPLAERAEHLSFLRYMHVSQAMLDLARGTWDEIERKVAWAIEGHAAVRCPGLVVLGRVQVRRGEGNGEQLLARGWELAELIDEPQRLAPAASALAEAAWLGGNSLAVRPLVAKAYRRIRPYASLAHAAELGFWTRALGEPVAVEETGYPYAILAAGRWRDAADLWHRAGCPYEYAIALAHSTDPSDLLTALSTVDSLAARPLARRIRQRLRQRGVTRIPRGPAPSTRDNPAGLTGRQLEIARLVAEGLSNAAIATRLVLSVRTVDTHVGAILNKLNVHSRRDVAAWARTRGSADT